MRVREYEFICVISSKYFERIRERKKSYKDFNTSIDAVMPRTYILQNIAYRTYNEQTLTNKL